MDVVDERRYAWLMLRAARRAHAAGVTELPVVVRDEINGLLREALEAGLDRTELVTALADLGGRLLMVCDPAASAAPSAVDVSA